VHPVPTASGPVQPGELGLVLPHEHLCVTTEGLAQNFPAAWDEARARERAVQKVRAARRHGVDTLVDPTVMGLGRDVGRVRHVVERTGIQVVMATGLYTYRDLPFYFRERPVDDMADLFVKDLEEGIQGTDVRAGFLKCATDEPGFSEGVEKTLRALARAHRRTGAPIMTHSHPASRNGLEQQDLLEEEGVDLSRVVIGHSGDTDDLDYLRALADRGSYLGMDRYGLDQILDTARRNATVAALCEEGYADRLHLSHDHAATIDWVEGDPDELLPDWSFTHLFEDVLPDLRDRGVTDNQIRTMTRENPRRWLTG